MKKTTLLLICLLIPGVALAFPGASLQTIVNDITVGPIPNVSSVNVTTDYITEGADAYWSIAGVGAAASTIVIELAGYAGSNKFGIYDYANPANVIQLFNGAASQGDQAFVSIKADGSVWLNNVDTTVDFASNNFGFYLNSPDGVFKSDSSLNSDNMDHMFAYQGKNIDTIQLYNTAPGLWNSNEYLLGWEDILGGGDADYDDFVVMVESVNPVPEPISMLLFGTGLVAAGGYVRRRFKK